MEDFYFYTCVVALIVLIIMLTMIGITISYGNQVKIYPPHEKKCPDYWTGGDDPINATDMSTTPAKGDYCRFPDGTTGKNQGNNVFQAAGAINVDEWTDITSASGLGGVSAGDKKYVRFSNNDATWTALYPGLTPRCAKRKWASDRSIVWDGVTNYNGCK
jgi:hypothetical protein